MSIKSIRKEKGLLLSHVAKMAGVSCGYISELENGKLKSQNPSEEILKKIADALRVSVSDLLEEKKRNKEISKGN